jgi:hypothetical protein
MEDELKQYHLSKDNLATIFDEWMRRYKADPEAFLKEYSPIGEYGEDCATYFVELVKELL